MGKKKKKKKKDAEVIDEINKNPELIEEAESTNNEIGVIGIGLALVALAASVIFDENSKLVLKIISLVVYVLGGLAISFLYFSFISKVIPNFYKAWLKKGGMKIKGIFWIFWYYIKLLFRQMTIGNRLEKIQELGYLTILGVLSILWLIFGIVIGETFVEIIKTWPNNV